MQYTLVAAALLLGAVASAHADVVTLNPTVDLYVVSGTKSNNTWLDLGDNAGGPGQDARALLKFDLSALAGMTINSATLRLNQIEQGSNDQYGNAQLRRIGTSDWDGTEAAATLYNLVADGSSAYITNFSPAVNPPAGWKEVDVLSVVQDWADGTNPNYGFGLKQGSEGFTNTGRRFTSGNATVNMPELLVDFVPEPTTLALAAVGLLGVARRRR